ncbi:hypothetical protein DL96DRAFT_1668698 [Flagelloscypha sp. PMI_526]|nr:hypothetical protein DL96DRAFT_1668698 [Flagelloscypha sp. PMI_526]
MPPHASSRHRSFRSFPARRTATSVLAGDFDLRPHRDVLTSLLNGVPPYAAVEGDDELRRLEKRERKRLHKERRKAIAEEKARERQLGIQNPSGSTSSFAQAAAAKASTSFWQERPSIHIPTMRQRSISVSPPPSPMHRSFDSSASTPSPSESSSVTRTSSKRLRTPEDEDDLMASPTLGRAIKKRPVAKPKKTAVRKGWKGWVEATEDESLPTEKLINLDNTLVFQDRKTRSGKHFDAWV